MSAQGRDLDNIGNIYQILKKYSEALKIYKRSYDIFHEIGGTKQKVTVICNIANIYYKQKKYDKALRRFQEAYDIFEDLKILNLPSAKKVTEMINELK